MFEPRSKPERQRVTSRGVQRVGLQHEAAERASGPDEIAVEEPLEIRLAGDTLATIMRTPGDDHRLVAGFLYSEGVIRSLADLGKIAHCGRPSDAGYGNLVDVAPGPGTALAPERESQRRGTIVSASCGVCGRARIDDLLARLGRLPLGASVARASVSRSVEQLARAQVAFARTGGVHGALALAADGTELAASEDVGRHNAVDKVIGALLLQAAMDSTSVGAAHDPLAAACVLVVSGRISFEIVQKACVARIPAVCGISGPTSLAIDLAERCGIALAGFVRDGALNLYTSAARELVRTP